MQILQRAAAPNFAEICQLAPQAAFHFQPVPCSPVITRDTVDVCVASVVRVAAELPREGRRADRQRLFAFRAGSLQQMRQQLSLTLWLRLERTDLADHRGMFSLPSLPAGCPARREGDTGVGDVLKGCCLLGHKGLAGGCLKSGVALPADDALGSGSAIPSEQPRTGIGSQVCSSKSALIASGELMAGGVAVAVSVWTVVATGPHFSHVKS